MAQARAAAAAAATVAAAWGASDSLPVGRSCRLLAAKFRTHRLVGANALQACLSASWAVALAAWLSLRASSLAEQQLETCRTFAAIARLACAGAGPVVEGARRLGGSANDASAGK